MKRGFTLIEILAVVILMAAIFLASFPLFLGTAKKDKQNKYNSMVESLCSAGKSYIYAEVDDYDMLNTVGSVITINIQDLISYGNVNVNTKNDLTGNTIEDDSLEYTVLEDFSLKCKYVDN